MLNPAEIIGLKGKRKLTMLTAYDYPSAKILSEVGIDILLVGDSLGMVVLGFKDTKSVTLADIVRHTAAVVRGNLAVQKKLLEKSASGKFKVPVSSGAFGSLVVADMPLHTTDTAGMAIRNCRHVLEETGAHAVKVEGEVKIVEALVAAGIAVMGHTGLKPQTAERYGLTGVGKKDAESILAEALALEKAGAFAVVLECVPTSLATKITKSLKVPTIGIGAGNSCDGQVLVISDMIGLFEDFKPKFVRRYADAAGLIRQAVSQFKKDVEDGGFPNENESFN